MVPAPNDQSDSYGRRKSAATRIPGSHRRRHRSSRPGSSPGHRRARAPGSGGTTGGTAPVMAGGGTTTGATRNSPSRPAAPEKPGIHRQKTRTMTMRKRPSNDRSSSARQAPPRRQAPETGYRGMGKRPVLRIRIRTPGSCRPVQESGRTAIFLFSDCSFRHNHLPRSCLAGNTSRPIPVRHAGRWRYKIATH